MQEISTLSFNGGLNTDLDNSRYDDKTYIGATNFTATSPGGNTLGALENAKGNELVSSLVFATDHVIVGHINVVDEIVFFTTDETDSNIYLYSDDSLTLFYSDSASTYKLSFSTDLDYRIVGTGRKETSTIKKVYWTDGLNELRYLDLNRDYTGSEANAFNIIPPNDLSTSITSEIIAGSGLYNAGTVYYAYQLYTKNGASSTISQQSMPFKLSEYSDVSDGGTDTDNSSYCALKVTVSGISDELLSIYSRIRFYSIFYDNTTTPVINIVDERSISESSISFIDTGDTSDEITTDEFIAYNQTTYIPQTLATKDNYLFIGNLKEDVFSNDDIDDWDARAYRFDSTGEAKIWSADYSNYITLDSTCKVTGGDVSGLAVDGTEDVPYDFDCRNKYNNTYTNSLYDRNANNGYKYTSGGTTIGGTGLNISYSFESRYKVIDSTTYSNSYGVRESSDFVISNQSDNFSGSTNTTYDFPMVECEDGEVYRIGIRFFNAKGQTSFVKWIGDILWEEALTDKVNSGTTNSIATAKVLKVTVDDTNLPESTTSYQLVRCVRNSTDITAPASGLLKQTETYGTEEFERPALYLGNGSATSTRYGTMFSYDSTKKLYTFIAPNLMFNDATNTNLDNFKVRLYNKVSETNSDFEYNNWGASSAQNALVCKSLDIHPLITTTDELPFSNLIDIDYYKNFAPVYAQDGTSDVELSIGDYKFINQHRNFYNSDDYGAGCSTVVMQLDSEISIQSYDTTLTNTFFYASIVRSNELTRYGGISYASILNSEYIPFSEVSEAGTTTTDLYGIYGDAYTNHFYFMESMFYDSSDSADSGYILSSFPVQSRIDLRKRTDRLLEYVPSLDSVLTSDDDEDTMHPQESAALGIEYYGTVYDTDLGDLYTYNTAYSAQNNSMLSYPKPFDYDSESTLTTKVLVSDKKINGENEDGWTNFATNDFIEVDTEYGDLNNLVTFNNILYFWQGKGFGKIGSSARSLISDDSGSQLSLGTGGVLERIDYISTESGNVDKGSISKSENALFWVDSTSNSIFKFNGQLENISISKGISNYISVNPISNPISVSDFTAKETLFKIGDNVLAFDWLNEKFTSDYSYTPSRFIQEYDGNILSTEDDESVYRHNSDDVIRGTYYGVANNSTLKLISNTNFESTKVFDVLNWKSNSTDTTTLVEDKGIDNYLDTFTNYRLYNDYQNTDWQTISLVRKDRSFTTIIPRDVVNQPQSSNINIFDSSNLEPTQTYKRRMRDKYIIIDLEYINLENTTFSVPYINVGYRKSIR